MEGKGRLYRFDPSMDFLSGSFIGRGKIYGLQGLIVLRITA